MKYHQSHAHGSADDDDTKDVTSMSENDESNIEAPSPVTPVKSPEKSQDSPLSATKRDEEIAYIFKSSNILDVPSQPTTPRSTPPSPAIPQGLPDLSTGAGVDSPVENKNVVKPGVLRFNNAEEFPVGVFSSNKSQVSGELSIFLNLAYKVTFENLSTNIETESENIETETKNIKRISYNSYSNALFRSLK